MVDLSTIVKCLAVASAVALLQMSVAVFADEPNQCNTLPPIEFALPSFPTASASNFNEGSGGEVDPPPIEIPELSWQQDDSVDIDFSNDEAGELPRWYDDWFGGDVLDSGPVLDSGGGNPPSTPTMAQDIAAIRSNMDFFLYGLLPFGLAVLIFWLFAKWFYRTFIASAFF